VLLILALTLLAAAVVYLLWRRRDHEHAHLVTEPERPDRAPASPRGPSASPPAAPVDEPAGGASGQPPAAGFPGDDQPDDGDEDSEEPPGAVPPIREPATAETPASGVASTASVRPIMHGGARRDEQPVRLPGAATAAMPGGGINLPSRRPATPPRI
jgi:hypothetical protein